MLSAVMIITKRSQGRVTTWVIGGGRGGKCFERYASWLVRCYNKLSKRLSVIAKTVLYLGVTLFISVSVLDSSVFITWHLD